MDKAPAAAAANNVANPPVAAAANNVAHPPAAVLQVVVIAPAANVVVNAPANVVVNPSAEAASACGAAASAANANAWKKKKKDKCCMIFLVVGQTFLALLLVAHAAYNAANSPAPGAADVALLTIWLICLALSVVMLVLLCIEK
ncbi:hypothetical protein VPH35_069267 [Triticum aestivum]|uniref:uncharacterized protein n=2 Tax=cellular organisms TaxID=131567 RepID=UPI001D02E710|nr:uncharacterized protein LOC123083098 [Triticum aestivum]